MVVLYVDDDPEDIEIFVEAVNEIDASINCLVARNGKQAMEILHSDKTPDFVFLDINMPVINGKVLLSEIRKDRKFDAIPVVMYSTGLNQGDVEELGKAGANHFLTKHNHFQELCDAVAAILRD